MSITCSHISVTFCLHSQKFKFFSADTNTVHLPESEIENQLACDLLINIYSLEIFYNTFRSNIPLFINSIQTHSRMVPIGSSLFQRSLIVFIKMHSFQHQTKSRFYYGIGDTGIDIRTIKRKFQWIGHYWLSIRDSKLTIH